MKRAWDVGYKHNEEVRETQETCWRGARTDATAFELNSSQGSEKTVSFLGQEGIISKRREGRELREEVSMNSWKSRSAVSGGREG
eukprot:608625-Hanusia_phi.AAC.6